MLRMKWHDIKSLIEYPEGVLSKELVKGKSSVTLFCMAKGTEISEHTSARQGFVYVIEGRGVFSLEGAGIAMEPGILISMRANAKHSLKAEENTSFLLFLWQ